MYALALIFALSGNQTQKEIIGVFSTQLQCEAASRSQSSATRCYLLDPEKGMVEIDSPVITGSGSNKYTEPAPYF